MKQPCFLSIDVGTASLRTALVSMDGFVLAKEQEPISLWLSDNRMEQSTDNIWEALTSSIRRLLVLSGISPLSIQGMGIDATASLVLLDNNLMPLLLPDALSATANIIGWMDHRAQKQALELTKNTTAELKKHCRISAEDHLPRLLWLKQEVPDTWKQCRLLLDLSDYLTYRCTSVLHHSSLSLLARLPEELLQATGINPSKLSSDRINALGSVDV